MKIKRKNNYFFHKNISCENYPFKELSDIEIENFINENIVFKDGRFYYNDFLIPSYWYNNSPRLHDFYIYLQTGVKKFTAIDFLISNSYFKFVHNLEYDTDNLRMMILYNK